MWPAIFLKSLILQDNFIPLVNLDNTNEDRSSMGKVSQSYSHKDAEFVEELR